MEISIKTKKKYNNAPKSKQIIERQCYLMLLFPIIGFVVFTVYPILWAASKSFFFFNYMPEDTKYVGLENFVAIFTKDKAYWESWLTTLKFAIYKLPIEIPFALLLAILLSKGRKGSNFFRTMYYMPNMISVAIVGVVFSNLFNYFGFINAFLIRMGMLEKGIDWFARPETAMFVLVAGSVWCTFGINVLYFSSALNYVPKELYESAEIDGAGSVVKFFRITLPMIAPVFQVMLLLSINGTLHVGEYILVMTNGAPAGSTFTVGAYIISKFIPGFSTGVVNVGYGCALSIITSIMYGCVAIVYMKMSKKMSEVY